MRGAPFIVVPETWGQTTQITVFWYSGKDFSAGIVYKQITVYTVLFFIICFLSALVFGAAVSMPRSKKGKRSGNSSSKGEFNTSCCHRQYKYNHTAKYQ